MVAAAAMIVLLFLVVVFADPKTTVQLTNDTPQTLSLGCNGASPTVAPDHKVSIPMSIFNPFPCLVSVDKSGKPGQAARWMWFGCLRLNPLIDHATRLSQLVSRISLERCWANAPR